MDLDKLLDKIAIEEAPTGLVHRWKMDLMTRREAKTRSTLWPYIVLPVALSGVYIYITVFNRGWLTRISDFSSQSYNNLLAFKDRLFEGFSIAEFGGFMEGVRNVLSFGLNSASEFLSSGSFIIWSIVFSLAIAILSLVWYFFLIPDGERLFSRI
ncbi:MAG: hypothetical protein NWE90_06325 [Candidatus Bathyarchaeota archaeon]|nr:hypothetical protein [Candidatus Bathyarchaeota archaeon]